MTIPLLPKGLIKTIVSFSLLAIILLASLGGIALFLAVEHTPMLRHQANMTPERIARGKRIFLANDPRKLRPGQTATVGVAQEDLDLAINYFANQYLNGIAGLSVNKSNAELKATFKLLNFRAGQYINIRVFLDQTDNLPEIDHILVGKLRIPGLFANLVVNNFIGDIPPLGDWHTLTNIVQWVEFEPGKATVTYRWQKNMSAKLGGVFLPQEEQQRIAAYQQQLATLTMTGQGNLKLSELLQKLFAVAKTRSIHGDAIAENRALILVLTFYANQKPINKLLQHPQYRTYMRWRTVTLNDRDDFAKHYLVSATLAAYAGTPLADAVGLFKELEDAQGGSGFSFNDIAADRAGTLIGELAISNPQQAIKIQNFMASAKEFDFMPATADLPEFMQESEFQRRFGGTQGKAYAQMMAEIERRIAALNIVQQSS